MQGKISVHARGFGFVANEEQDIFIPKPHMNGAVNGDIVEVEIAPDYNRKKGPEGKVIAVVERAHDTLAGIVESRSKKNTYFVHVPMLGESQEVLATSTKKLEEGDRIEMKVKEWGQEDKPTICTYKRTIGSILKASDDIPAAVCEFGLTDTFTKQTLDEAKAFGTSVRPSDREGRADLTKIETFTVDPVDAKDYDDALSLSQKGGEYFLSVHIADVSHYVQQGSHLDVEASRRGNSTYLPGTCIPMLPEELSNNLCSLREGVLRLAVTVHMTFDKEANLKNYRIERSVIKSQKRLTYQEAMEILDGKLKSPHAKTLKLMEELALLLKKKRNARGSIDLAMPEVRLKLDKKGIPQGYEIIEYDITHQLVEEFMLKANELVAQHLVESGKQGIFRIHEDPAEEKLNAFYDLARSLGFQLPPKPQTEDIQKLFQLAKSSPHLYRLSVGFVRSMKLAIYSDQNVGHYGLSLDFYTHFTSPIRRYSDLIIHRLLFDECEEGDLKKVATLCSETEKKSFRAESDVRKLKMIRLLDGYMEKDPDHRFKARVSKIKPFGLFFELEDLLFEGFIHISDIGNDYFIFDPSRETLRGEKTGKLYTVAKEIEVELNAIDLIYKECEWLLC